MVGYQLRIESLNINLTVPKSMAKYMSAKFKKKKKTHFLQVMFRVVRAENKQCRFSDSMLFANFFGLNTGKFGQGIQHCLPVIVSLV